MKAKILLPVFIAALFYTNQLFCQWQAVGTVSFSPGEIGFISMTLNENGTPYVAFQDALNGNKLTVMFYNGGSWVTVGSAGISPTTIDNVAIAIDSATADVFVAYTDSAANDSLSVQVYRFGSWYYVGPQHFSDGSASDLSLIVVNDTPVIAYSDGGAATTNAASVQLFNGVAWTYVGPAAFTASAAYYTSLAVDHNGKYYIAFEDYSNGEE